MPNSKQLGHADDSGFEFVQEMLKGDATAAVNFDRIQLHPTHGYIIFEYLLCDKKQNNSITPYTSHPKRYWNKNHSKFISLWHIAHRLNATLYLVNYGSADDLLRKDQILLIKVLGVDDSGIYKEEQTQFTRDTFSDWFRQLNKECLNSEHIKLYDIFLNMDMNRLSQRTLLFGKYKGKNYIDVYNQNKDYLQWCSQNCTDMNVQMSILAFLKRKEME